MSVCVCWTMKTSSGLTGASSSAASRATAPAAMRALAAVLAGTEGTGRANVPLPGSNSISVRASVLPAAISTAAFTGSPSHSTCSQTMGSALSPARRAKGTDWKLHLRGSGASRSGRTMRTAPAAGLTLPWKPQPPTVSVIWT